MKDNDNSQKTFGGGRTKMLVAAGIVIVAAIVALKLLSNGPHPAPVPPATPPAATATPDILPPDSDETAASADSIERSPIRTWGWTGRAQGRYVRVQAPAGEKKGWIFTDEIVVR